MTWRWSWFGSNIVETSMLYRTCMLECYTRGVLHEWLPSLYGNKQLGAADGGRRGAAPKGKIQRVGPKSAS